jgi:serine/threonine-protein kinase
MAEARSRDHWIWHVLRREAEALIFPSTAAFLEGKHQPQDNVERLALLGVCRFKNLNCTLARLYSEALAADPNLADDPHVSHRYNAACAAALAGCGLGEDAGKLSEAERARWRKQARQWLADELTTLDKRIPGALAPYRARLQRTLMRWQTSADLAGLREPSALDKLPPAERQECRTLWSDVDALVKRVHDLK